MGEMALAGIRASSAVELEVSLESREIGTEDREHNKKMVYLCLRLCGS